MRIGVVAPPWLAIPPYGYGGIEAMIDVLAVALAAAGHEVVLAASSDSTCEVNRLPGFAPSDPASLGSSAAELRHVLRAYERLRAAGVDIIHDHTLVGPHLGRAAGIPIVTTAHGPFDALLGPIYAGLPAEVDLIAISRHQASTMEGAVVTRVIHHGVETAAIPVGAGAGGYACFLGRMSPDKGVRAAIEVARRAGIPVRIAAKMRNGEEHDYFSSEIKPLLDSTCEYLGELGSADKYALLGAAVALVNPIDWHEPFGMVMIESMATGTPVLATPRGSAPEIVEDGRTGFLRSSIPELAEALGAIGEVNRGDCRDVTTTRFSARRMAADYAEVFAEAVAVRASVP